MTLRRANPSAPDEGGHASQLNTAAIRRHQWPSVSIRRHQTPSVAIRRYQTPSVAISRHQPSSAMESWGGASYPMRSAYTEAPIRAMWGDLARSSEYMPA